MDTKPGMAANVLDTHVMKKSVDGKNFAREHVIRAKI
jgi:hypothetical protein